MERSRWIIDIDVFHWSWQVTTLHSCRESWLVVKWLWICLEIRKSLQRRRCLICFWTCNTPRCSVRAVLLPSAMVLPEEAWRGFRRWGGRRRTSTDHGAILPLSCNQSPSLVVYSIQIRWTYLKSQGFDGAVVDESDPCLSESDFVTSCDNGVLHDMTMSKFHGMTWQDYDTTILKTLKHQFTSSYFQLDGCD